jgi:hypothetical protein
MLSDSELRDLQERLTQAPLGEDRDDIGNACYEFVTTDALTLLRAVGEYRELIQLCIEHLEDCTDTWTPTDLLLRALRVSLKPSRSQV